MAKTDNLKDYLTDLYEGIKTKKPNASRNPQDFRQEIESIESGATIKTQGSWQGTQVPNNSYVENVYLNTNLSVEEVVNIIGSANLTYDEQGISYILKNASFGLAVMHQEGIYIILDFATLTSYFHNVEGGEEEAGFVAGWNPNVTMPIVVNSEIMSMDENAKLTSLISTTPFTYQEGTPIELSGEYDGSNIEVTEAGKIDIKALIEEKKIPLEINVTYEGGSGVVEVDELPTIPQTDVIYQVNKPTDIDVLVWVGAPYSRVNLEQIFIENGITPILIYEVVDSLPETPNVSDLQTFSPTHVYICENIAYVYGNVGYGDMWLEVVTLFNNLAQTNLENKGYINSKKDINEPGFYITYKKGKKGIYAEKYSLLEYTGGWNDLRSFFEGTVSKFYNNEITKIRDFLFCGNIRLQTISFPQCTNIGSSAFAFCSSLTSVSFPQCTYIGGGAFESCTSLTSVSFPMCTDIGYSAFQSCTNLQEANFPLCTYIGGSAFYYCKSLQTISFPQCTYIGYSAFQYCESLTSVSFPMCTDIGYSAFQSCTNLQEANFPLCTYIGGSAFYYCSSLQNISFPMCTSIGTYAFQSCTSLQSAFFPQCSSMSSYVFANCTSLQEANFPVCKYIGSYAFRSCNSLTSVSFPLCTSIGSGTFAYCSSLQEGSFPKCTYIGSSAFYYCKSLTNISFPMCSEIKGYAFISCTSLQEVNFSECRWIGGNAFAYCSSLQEGSFPKCTYIGDYAFYYCSSLQNIISPSCKYIGGSAFESCTSLQEVSFPLCSSIVNSAFTNCTSLQSIYLNVRSVPILDNTNVFVNTPLSDSSYLGYYGSIYVPGSLYEAFKTATNWNQYADRIVSYEY